MEQRKLLITGAAGRIGSHFRNACAGRYQLRLADVKPIADAGGHEVVPGDVADLEQLRCACDGIDTVLHLAAHSSPDATFDELLRPNLIGPAHVFQAARERGCRRIVFASSIHVVIGYPVAQSVTEEMPVNPVCPYGVSKCYGEALARCHAHSGLSAICVRLGAVATTDSARKLPPHLSEAWISYRDVAHLLERCIETEHIEFAIVHGLSRHRTPRLDMRRTCQLLGYEPQDGSVP